MVDMEEMSHLDLRCIGGKEKRVNYHKAIFYCLMIPYLGYNCCTRERPCQEKEGDCNRDDECFPGAAPMKK